MDEGDDEFEPFPPGSVLVPLPIRYSTITMDATMEPRPEEVVSTKYEIGDIPVSMTMAHRFVNATEDYTNERLEKELFPAKIVANYALAKACGGYPSFSSASIEDNQMCNVVVRTAKKIGDITGHSVTKTEVIKNVRQIVEKAKNVGIHFLHPSHLHTRIMLYSDESITLSVAKSLSRVLWDCGNPRQTRDFPTTITDTEIYAAVEKIGLPQEPEPAAVISIGVETKDDDDVLNKARFNEEAETDYVAVKCLWEPLVGCAWNDVDTANNIGIVMRSACVMELGIRLAARWRHTFGGATPKPKSPTEPGQKIVETTNIVHYTEIATGIAIAAQIMCPGKFKPWEYCMAVSKSGLVTSLVRNMSIACAQMIVDLDFDLHIPTGYAAITSIIHKIVQKRGVYEVPSASVIIVTQLAIVRMVCVPIESPTTVSKFVEEVFEKTKTYMETPEKVKQNEELLHIIKDASEMYDGGRAILCVKPSGVVAR